MRRNLINWACYKIVMAWPGQLPAGKWFLWMLARAGWYADYPCEGCIGMKDHGCYCKAMNAIQPGGPAAEPEVKRRRAGVIAERPASERPLERNVRCNYGDEDGNEIRGKLLR